MRHLAKHRPALLPALLIVLGVCLLQGCLFIPTFDKLKSGKDVSKAVGDANSRKRLRVGVSTLDDVIAVLGPPHYATPDRSEVAYVWTVTNGIWVWPFCFTAYPQEGKRALVLDFDRGLLRSYRVEKMNGNWYTPTVTWFPVRERMLPFTMPPPPGSSPPAAPPPSAPTAPAPPPGPQYRTTPSQ